MKRKIFLGVVAFLIALGAYGVVTEPLLWQRFAYLFLPGDDPTFRGLQPREVILGDQTMDLPVATEDERTMTEDALADMRAYAAEQNSFALIVVHKGKIQTEWYADGYDRNRLTQSQSMHKSVLPILVQAAIEDGDIGSLDDPIGTYLAEWQDDPRGAITVTQLLHMSSGLLEYEFSLNPTSDDFRWLFDANTTPVLLRTPLDWKPGTKFEYNNVNSELLGLIIERATGKRYSDYLNEKLWTPMGGERAELWMDSEGGKAHSSCCLLAPTRDWARFGMMMLGRGTINGHQIVDASFIDKMISPSPTFAWYGFQIWLGYSLDENPRARLLAGAYQRNEPFDARDTYYASGFGGQRVYVVPSEDLVIVRMGPSSGRAPVKETWDNTYLVNTALRNLVETPNSQFN